MLREGSDAGLLIHGLGRVGKSSLAARLAHRRPDLALAVVFGRYDALSVAEAIKDACPEAVPPASMPHVIGCTIPRVLGVLRQVLEGPCAQVGVGKPLLLVIDDLERILDEPLLGSSQWRVQAAYHPMLRAVLRACLRRARTVGCCSPVATCSPCPMATVTSLTVSLCSCHPWMGRVPASKCCVPRRRACAYARAHSAATSGTADALRRGRPGESRVAGPPD